MKNLLWLVFIIVLSFFTTFYFGLIGSYFTSQEVLFSELLPFLLLGSVGGSLAFIFFVVFIFSLHGFRKNKYWIIIPLIPYILLWLSSDIHHIYLPILIGFIAYVLAFCIKRIYKDLKKSNTPRI